MKSEYFKNDFPLEHLLPDLTDEEKVLLFDAPEIMFDESPIEFEDEHKESAQVFANEIAEGYFLDGYRHAQAIIQKKLKALKVETIVYSLKL